ncbi:MAG: T9SS type A sorting domain-containing protein, partial [Candidatus Cloacimonetes bacterium]|nr:T9SS type A sorting domain-containing protein [Candidatus Cloacimonadota bacterium]MCF7814014.1 T9SS type A sorting domain-containing protein [Candidatus Cloacimonadota bacterium]
DINIWERIGYNYPRLIDNPDPTLPVTLSSFTGNIIDGFPTLNWITESELENLGWNIYRSQDENGIDNNNVLKLNDDLIPGMGTVTTPTEYNYIDEQPILQPGVHYYWLESVSYSGELEVFGPVSINLNSSNITPGAPEKSFVNQNHPNPFNPTTTIQFGIEEGETGTLTIYNVLGQKVISQKYEAGFHTFTWNASKQASGVYFYRLQTPSYHKTIRMLMLK